jgi:AraC-like DNA-binding protein
MIRAHLYTILYHVLHNCPKTGETVLDRHMNYDKLKVVLEFLRENYAKDTSVEEAAYMCGFSPSHFMKLFRELTGSSFTQYVKNLRLEAAARLLRTTGKRVSDIAEEVGFHNLPYFTRAFGCKYHISPLQYRENSCSIHLPG